MALVLNTLRAKSYTVALPSSPVKESTAPSCAVYEISPVKVMTLPPLPERYLEMGLLKLPQDVLMLPNWLKNGLTASLNAREIATGLPRW